MNHLNDLKTEGWTPEETRALSEELAEHARKMPERIQNRVSNIVAGPDRSDPRVISCYKLLMASTWTARYGTEDERWGHAARMARVSAK